MLEKLAQTRLKKEMLKGLTSFLKPGGSTPSNGAKLTRLIDALNAVNALKKEDYGAVRNKRGELVSDLTGRVLPYDRVAKNFILDSEFPNRRETAASTLYHNLYEGNLNNIREALIGNKKYKTPDIKRPDATVGEYVSTMPYNRKHFINLFEDNYNDAAKVRNSVRLRSDKSWLRKIINFLHTDTMAPYRHMRKLPTLEPGRLTNAEVYKKFTPEEILWNEHKQVGSDSSFNPTPFLPKNSHIRLDRRNREKANTTWSGGNPIAAYEHELGHELMLHGNPKLKEFLARKAAVQLRRANRLTGYGDSLVNSSLRQYMPRPTDNKTNSEIITGALASRYNGTGEPIYVQGRSKLDDDTNYFDRRLTRPTISGEFMATYAPLELRGNKSAIVHHEFDMDPNLYVQCAQKIKGFLLMPPNLLRVAMHLAANYHYFGL